MIRVQVEASAQGDLGKLDPTISRKVLDKLDALEEHPEPHKWLKKLKVAENSFRLHIGTDWVAIGILRGTVFYVNTVCHRSDDYRSFKRR